MSESTERSPTRYAAIALTEMAIRVAVENGMVVVEANLAIVPENLTPRQARTLAIALLEAATLAEDQPKP